MINHLVYPPKVLSIILQVEIGQGPERLKALSKFPLNELNMTRSPLGTFELPSSSANVAMICEPPYMNLVPKKRLEICQMYEIQIKSIPEEKQRITGTNVKSG